MFCAWGKRWEETTWMQLLCTNEVLTLCDTWIETLLVFVFDEQNNHITYDIPQDEYKRLMQEVKANFAQLQKDRNEI